MIFISSCFFEFSPFSSNLGYNYYYYSWVWFVTSFGLILSAGFKQRLVCQILKFISSDCYSIWSSETFKNKQRQVWNFSKVQPLTLLVYLYNETCFWNFQTLNFWIWISVFLWFLLKYSVSFSLFNTLLLKGICRWAELS